MMTSLRKSFARWFRLVLFLLFNSFLPRRPLSIWEKGFSKTGRRRIGSRASFPGIRLQPVGQLPGEKIPDAMFREDVPRFFGTVLELKEGCCFGPSVMLFDRKGFLIRENSLEWGHPAEDSWPYRRFFLPKQFFLKGKGLLLASTGGETYYHFMCDVLAKLHILEMQGIKAGDFDHILLNTLDKPFVRDLVNMLHFKETQLRALDQGHGYRVERLVVPSPVSILGSPHKAIAAFFQKHLPRPTPPSGQKRRLWISRKNTKARVLFQEEKLHGFLKKHGFSICELENLSVADQMGFFFGASLVVAPHGAGLTNLLFTRPNTLVLEMFSFGSINQCYRVLASTMKSRYFCLQENQSRGDRDPKYLYLSHERIKRAIRHLLSKE